MTTITYAEPTPDNKKTILPTLTKRELINELCKREGVNRYSPNEYGHDTVLCGVGWNSGIATILVIKE